MTWPEPRGGFFIWTRLPEAVDAEAMLQRATVHKVVFVIGSAFYVNGAGRNLLRLSFSQPTPDRIEEGVRRLAAVVHEELELVAQGVSVGGGASKGTGAPTT